MSLPPPACWAVLLLAIPASAFPAHAQDRSFADLLPDSTIAYVEVAPAENWLKHPIRERVEKSEAFAKLSQNPEAVKLRGGIQFVELLFGDTLENMALQLTAGGAAVAFDRQTEGAILIAGSIGQDWLDAYVKRGVKLARDNASGSGQPDPINESEYRGFKVYKSDGTIVAAISGYLLVTNKQELGKTVADRVLDGQAGAGGTPPGLSDLPAFELAAQARASDSARDNAGQDVAWGYLDLQTVREAGVAKELLGGEAKDFAAEVILGGILATLHQTPMLTGTLRVEDSSAELRFSAPHDRRWDADRREFFFGPEGNGRASRPLEPTGTVATISAYRDLSQMWLRAGDLFNDQVNDQLAQADGTLTTLFSGRDFGADILGAFYPELRLVVARHENPDEETKPAITIPGFALVARLREPDMMRGELKRIFQSLIGFLNIVGAMEGQPQLDLDMETDDGNQLVTATYVRDVDRQKDGQWPIQYNFSPTIAFVNDSIIISSTTTLAKDLNGLLTGDDPSSVVAEESADNLNTLLRIDGPALYQALEDNRGQLVAQNMLEGGTTKQEAENEIGVLFSILEMFQELTVRLGFSDQAALEVHVELAE